MMDIYESGLKYFATLKTVDRWPELHEGFERMAEKKPRGWALPVTACEAVGGTSEIVIPAVVAIGCMQWSIILIDDMLDEDPRGKHNKIGPAATANLASAFQAAGLQAIWESDAEEDIKLAAQASLNSMMLMTALGQTLDVQNPQSEEGYWKMVQTKSSPYYGSALYIGALLGGASYETAEQLRKFGTHY
ncbi:MAG: polyprenyl synthetase family protein, partial [Chloroflexi bacterium]|nr:polyprenyl synthetase family protein [Chloroflexota bacterium]